jgi:phosphate starvation-inducible protein PhoH
MRRKEKGMAKRKVREDSIAADLEARAHGPQQKKKWSLHDIRHIKPVTENQMAMLAEYEDGYNILARGSAGTGKTLISLYMAAVSILDPKQDQKKITIVRSIVPSRDIGFLPGTLEEKISIYEQPYRDIMAMLFGRASTYDDMKAAGLVEFHTTSFVRGLTWNDAVIILDEAQNCAWQEVNSIMTRVGENSRVIVIGDNNQDDLAIKGKEKSGFDKLVHTCHYMECFYNVCFTVEDIVRSSFVKDWIKASSKS